MLMFFLTMRSCVVPKVIIPAICTRYSGSLAA